MMERPPSFWELAVQATTNTRQGYNLLAPRFELTDYATPPWLIQACRDRVDSLFPIAHRQDAVGADLACGTGLACLALRKTCATVEGYDFSPRMLEQARKRFLAAPEPSCRAHFVEADLAELDLPKRRYDRVVTFGAWGHILPPWRERLMGQILACLRPSGVFYTVTADPPARLSRRWLRSALFDMAIHARNKLLGDPFHMYYLLNTTLDVKAMLERAAPCRVILEPVPRSPHPELTLLMAHSP